MPMILTRFVKSRWTLAIISVHFKERSNQMKNKKNNHYLSAFYAACGFLLALLPKLLVCPPIHTNGIMLCWRTAQMETLPGLLLIAASVLLFFTSGKILGHFIGFTASALGILFPLQWIGGCMDPSMLCNTMGFPLIYALCGLTGLASLLSLIKAAAKSRRLKLSQCRHIKE